MASVYDRLDRDAEAWKPEPGDKLVGTVVEIDERTSDYGSYPLLIVETDDGVEHAVHAFHTVLRNELARKRPRTGDTIGLAYRGKIDDRYEGYRVVIVRAEPETIEVDWDRHRVESEAEAAAFGVDPAEMPGAAQAGPDEDVPPPSEDDAPAVADVPY
jgi:hypothetical protein